ncbi:hypothetical protein ACQCN2_16160 [Brevibacillus ginsengisoli]|uniref:hypothetical protein n=1 Tax=Brevibacillus ginsengisoli TaxID=363854 RepID=UPI003CF6F036
MAIENKFKTVSLLELVRDYQEKYFPLKSKFEQNGINITQYEAELENLSKPIFDRVFDIIKRPVKFKNDEMKNNKLHDKSLVEEFEEKNKPDLYIKTDYKFDNVVGLKKIYFHVKEYNYRLDISEFNALFNFLLLSEVFQKADLAKSFENGQLISWSKKTLLGRFIKILNGKDEKIKYDFSAVSESDIKDEDRPNDYSLYDEVSFNDFISLKSSPKYEGFLHYFGGYEILLKSLSLAKEQRKVFDLVHEQNLTLTEISKLLNKDISTVKRSLEKANEKVKAKYLEYQLIAQKLKSNIYNGISSFLEFVDEVEIYDEKFRMLICLLKKEYKKETINYKELQKNRPYPTYYTNVFDLITDNLIEPDTTTKILTDSLHTGSWKVLHTILETGKFPTGLRERQKENIVNRCIKIFKSYIDDVNKIISKASKHIVKNTDSSYMKLQKQLKQHENQAKKNKNEVPTYPLHTYPMSEEDREKFTKVCIKCSEKKERNENNYLRRSSIEIGSIVRDGFYEICKSCYDGADI